MKTKTSNMFRVITISQVGVLPKTAQTILRHKMIVHAIHIKVSKVKRCIIQPPCIL